MTFLESDKQQVGGLNHIYQQLFERLYCEGRARQGTQWQLEQDGFLFFGLKNLAFYFSYAI